VADQSRTTASYLPARGLTAKNESRFGEG
jgi:hypothetical protein